MTFIVSKIAVGIFAGGVVFSTLLPELHLRVLGLDIDSFWIGSIAVIVMTGLYTALGGMRAVAYNDAVQVLVLITGSALLTFYGLYTLGNHHLLAGWGELRRLCGSDMFNLWKPLIPAGVQGTWEPVKEAGRMAWYFNGYFLGKLRGERFSSRAHPTSFALQPLPEFTPGYRGPADLRGKRGVG